MSYSTIHKGAVGQSLWEQCPAMQQELFGSSRDVSAPAMALYLAQRHSAHANAWLWVQDRASIRQTGRPFVHGLPAALQAGLVHVAAAKADDALFALEEGLRCTDFGFVIGELAGDPRVFDFTASRRLSVASERYAVPLYLVRHDAHTNLSAARRRWRIEPHISEISSWNARAPGHPRWQAELFRARGLPPGNWIVSDSHDRQPDRANFAATASYPLDLVTAVGDQPLAGERAA